MAPFPCVICGKSPCVCKSAGGSDGGGGSQALPGLAERECVDCGQKFTSVGRRCGACQAKLHGGDARPVVAFIFPNFIGHTNPALALARRFVSHDCRVVFAGCPDYQEAIEGTGATFVNRDEMNGKSVPGGLAGVGEMMVQNPCQAEFGEMLAKYPLYPSEKGMLFWMLAAHPLKEFFLDATVDWLQELKPDAVIHCTIVLPEVAIACSYLKISNTGLMTMAGPGSWDAIFGSATEITEFFNKMKTTLPMIERIQKKYGMDDLNWGRALPLDRDSYAPGVNLVTILEDLQWPISAEQQAMWDAKGINFRFVGPVIDIPGAKRAGQPTDKKRAEAGLNLGKRASLLGLADFEETGADKVTEKQLLHRMRSNVGAGMPEDIVESAIRGGRKFIFVSMGTVITDDLWAIEAGFAFSGKELCHAIYRSVFDIFGAETSDESATESKDKDVPLILISVGTKRENDALDGLSVPGNVIARTFLPQVALMEAGPYFMVSHGGQNSVLEALSYGVPCVLCPGFADQPGNAKKVEKLGAGLFLQRPGLGGGDAATFQALFSEALRKMQTNYDTYKAGAVSMQDKLKASGGVTEAVDIVMTKAGFK